MTIVNNINYPEAVIVGAPNLCKVQQMPSLLRNYTLKLDDKFKRKVQFASLQIDINGKYLKKQFVEDATQLAEYCNVNGIKVIGCTNPKFWQFATGDKQFTQSIGKALEGIGELSGITIVPLLNQFVLLAKPEMVTTLEESVRTLNAVLGGGYDFADNNLAEKVKKYLVRDVKEAEDILNGLLDSPAVTMDIETTGLVLGKDRIITIAMTDSTEYGYAFPLCPEYSEQYQEMTKVVAKFLKSYKGKHLWHNAMFDVPVILNDVLKVPFTNQSLIIKTLNRMDIEDTMHMAYLCKNSTSRENIGLKDLIYKKYGEYDGSIDQRRLLDYPFEDVGTYNILDVTATMEIYNEYYPRLTEEDQLDIFNDYYKVSLKNLIKLKYRGIDIDIDSVHKAKEDLEELINKEYEFLKSNPHVIETVYNLQANAMFKYNSTHKKQKTIADFKDTIEFNPNSSAQKAILLYDVMGLPVIETTDTGNPATGKDILRQLKTVVKDSADIELLDCLHRISEAAKVSTAFLEGFENLSAKAQDGSTRLHGTFKLHGTVSGRLSSSEP